MRIVETSIAFLFCIGVAQTFARVTINGVELDNTNALYLQAVRHMKVPFESQSGATWDAGNDVSGKSPAEVQTIVDAIKALETNIRQIEIYDKMKSTPTEMFAFATVAHAKNVVKQRLETVKMMEYFNNDKRYWYHSTTNPPDTNAASWEKGRVRPYFFRQKEGNAFDAIAQLCTPPRKTYGECYGALVACIWWGAHEGMGEAAFNALYPGQALDMARDNSAWRNTTNAIETDILVPGDKLYFKNYNYGEVTNTRYFIKQGWLDRNIIYFYSGENAFFNGDGKYEGLGEGTRNLTKSQMRDLLVEKYNTQLATVIAKLENRGGRYNGMEIVNITPLTAPTKITIESIRRLTHSP